MPRSIFVYVMLVLVGVVGAISDAVLNQWARTGRMSWLIASYGVWMVVATLLGVVLRWGYLGFSTAVVFFLVANCAAAVLIDLTLFGRRLGAWEWAGIALGVVAMAMIEIGRGRVHG